MTGDALFPDEGLRVAVDDEAAEELTTAGERLRRRQAARIAAGLHPLSYGRARIRLHPDAPRDAAKDDGRTYPRCGGCTLRQTVSGEHNGRYPKCLAGYDGERWSTAVRASNSEASDVRAWWPACVDYRPAVAS